MVENSVIIIGGFHEVIELCERIGRQIIGIIDNNLFDNYLGYPILGGDKDAEIIFEKYSDIPIVITPDSPKIRKKLVDYYSEIGFKTTSIISNRATISKSAKIGTGVIIQDGVNVSSFAVIGDFVKINSCANIMHDVIVSEFVTIAPNAVVLGRVTIRSNSYVGANSTILPALLIDYNTTIGAGAVVTKDTERDSVVVGVPAKKKL